MQAFQCFCLCFCEMLFFAYVFYPLLAGTFGHPWIRLAASLYVYTMLILIAILIVWVYCILNGNMLFGSSYRYNGWATLANSFEQKVQQAVILVIPVIIINLFHKGVFLTYYCKYYQWDNRDKKNRKLQGDSGTSKGQLYNQQPKQYQP